MHYYLMLKEVDAYIQKFPNEIQRILKKIRLTIKKSAPKDSEIMNYGVPGFKQDTKHFVLYAAFKNHIGLYPRPETIKHFSKELKEYKMSKGAIQFPLTQPIPFDVIKKISEFAFKD